MLFPDRNTFLELGPLKIEWYAVLILTGALCAYWFTQRKFVKAGYDKEVLSDWFFGILITGILGARIWYVIFEFNNQYKDNLAAMFAITDGGLAIQGGVLLAIAFSFWFFKKKNIPFLEVADMAMPTVLLGQAFGRWGNFLNQEAHGGEVSRQFLESLYLPDFIIEGMYIGGVYYHPTFLYESICNLIGFILLYFVISKFVKLQGVQFYGYFIWYGITRFFIEGMRTDSLYFLGLRMAQVTSIVFIIAGVIGIIYCIYKSKKIRNI